MERTGQKGDWEAAQNKVARTERQEGQRKAHFIPTKPCETSSGGSALQASSDI